VRGLRVFLPAGALTGRRPSFAMEHLIIGLIAAACLVYLVAAVLFPEKF
jgi:hypothetical protein